MGSTPLVCPTNLGGAIDPSPFIASDGTLWLLWKNDGNAIGQTTTIWLQQLTPDGLSFAGGATPLIHNDQVGRWCTALHLSRSMCRLGR